jgi:SpoVK/Ycf46/Vps4 family AAA+-type ATPase
VQVQLDGAATKASDFVLVIGATNRPQELDEAARRRFTKRVYVPLPNPDSRRYLVLKLLSTERHSLNNEGASGARTLRRCSGDGEGSQAVMPMTEATSLRRAFGG